MIGKWLDGTIDTKIMLEIRKQKCSNQAFFGIRTIENGKNVLRYKKITGRDNIKIFEKKISKLT